MSLAAACARPPDTSRHGPTDPLLLEVRREVPVVERVLRLHGARRLADFVPTQMPAPVEAWQGRDDFLGVVETVAAPLLGARVAARLREELALQATVLTANHHGVDFFAQSVQGSLVFSRRRLPDGSVARTVPVLACGTVPLDNLTYPMGMLVYDGPRLPLAAAPRRLPVLPNRVRRELVSVADAIDHGAPARALDGVRKLLDKGEVHEAGASVIGDLLAEDYGDDAVLAMTAYSPQASVLNARIWRRLHRGRGDSEMACLELEDVATRLLHLDLADGDSLVGRLLFEPRLRRALVGRLDGARACWDIERLRARLAGSGGGGGGTVLFWGVTPKLRRVPLVVDEDAAGRPLLVGVDDGGERHEFALEREALDAALAARRLLPAVFTSFAVLALARGVNCLGGYHQADYLPVMQEAVVATLREAGLDAMAEAVDAVPTAGYMGGMQAVLLERDEGLVPAGVVEMLAAGGLAPGMLERVDALDVDAAHRASLADTCAEMLPRERQGEDLRATVAAALRATGTGAVVLARP